MTPGSFVGNQSPATMKQNRLLSALFGINLALTGCTDVIDADLQPGTTQLSVDGWLTDQPGVQTIRLTQTAAYFNTATAPAATGAQVTVTDDGGHTYAFTNADGDSYYTWTPTGRDSLGVIGRSYRLTIAWQGQTYQATTRMNRVPTIDSLFFRFEPISPTSSEKGYQAEFYARDFAGAPDYYRIKFYRNGTLVNRPDDLQYVYDAGPGRTFNSDGLSFLEFIRQSINPEELYDENDEVRVELLSITAEAFDFLDQFKTQVTNNGLFAAPSANIPTNIVNTATGGPRATGFFVASAIRSRSARAISENLR